MPINDDDNADTTGAHERATALSDMVQFAAASGDFNPIHYDVDAARAAGLNRLILPGLLKAGWLADVGVSAMGSDWDLIEFDATYRGLDYVGDRARVGFERGAAEGDEAQLNLWSEDSNGSRTTLGQARFRRAARN